MGRESGRSVFRRVFSDLSWIDSFRKEKEESFKFEYKSVLIRKFFPLSKGADSLLICPDPLLGCLSKYPTTRNSSPKRYYLDLISALSIILDAY